MGKTTYWRCFHWVKRGLVWATDGTVCIREGNEIVGDYCKSNVDTHQPIENEINRMHIQNIENANTT